MSGENCFFRFSGPETQIKLWFWSNSDASKWLLLPLETDVDYLLQGVFF